MARIAIRRPVLLQQPGNMNTQKPPMSDGSNTFKQGDIVTLTAGVLALADKTATAFWGQTPDDSKLPTDIPPTAFFGENHYCFSLEDAIIEMNATNNIVTGSPAAGNAGTAGVGDATVNNGTVGPQLSLVTLGSPAGIRTDAVNYVGIQMVNINDTAAATVTIVGISPNQTVNDYNPRILVRIPRAKLQG